MQLPVLRQSAVVGVEVFVVPLEGSRAEGVVRKVVAVCYILAVRWRTLFLVCS